MFGTGYAFPGDSMKHYHAASTQRGLLQLIAYQAVATDCAGADGGRAEGAGSNEPDLSTDQGIASLSLSCMFSVQWVMSTSGSGVSAMLALSCVSIQRRP